MSQTLIGLGWCLTRACTSCFAATRREQLSVARSARLSFGLFPRGQVRVLTMCCAAARRSPSGEGSPRTWIVAVITMLVFQPASLMFMCLFHHGKHIACLSPVPRCCGAANCVCAAMAMINTKRTTQRPDWTSPDAGTVPHIMFRDVTVMNEACQAETATSRT